MIACFPAYILSTLWTDPGVAFNLMGLVSAVIQILALIYFLQMCYQIQSKHWNLGSVTDPSVLLVLFSMLMMFGLGNLVWFFHHENNQAD